MRNYIRLFGARWRYLNPAFPGIDFWLSGFAETEELLFDSTVRFKEGIIRQSVPGASFPDAIEPQIIWWKLNAKNLGIIVNGNSFGACDLMWNGCALPPIPNGQEFQWLQVNKVTETKYSGAKSPRKTWSHGH